MPFRSRNQYNKILTEVHEILKVNLAREGPVTLRNYKDYVGFGSAKILIAKAHHPAALLFIWRKQQAYNPLMPNPNPLAGVVPQVTHRSDVDETTIVEQIEKIEGEIAADAYIKALVSAPEVVERITELESCLQRLANLVLEESDLDRRSMWRAAAEQAGILLKNRLEVGDLRQTIKHRIRGRLRRFLEGPEFSDDPPGEP